MKDVADAMLSPTFFFGEKIRKASHKYKPFFIQAIAFGEALANAGSRKVRYC